MSRRQGPGFGQAGGDWFGRCGGWHAAVMRGRYVTVARAFDGSVFRSKSMRDEPGELDAREVEQIRASAVWGKVVVCAIDASGAPECRVITRAAAAQLLIDLQMALHR